MAIFNSQFSMNIFKVQIIFRQKKVQIIIKIWICHYEFFFFLRKDDIKSRFTGLCLCQNSENIIKNRDILKTKIFFMIDWLMLLIVWVFFIFVFCHLYIVQETARQVLMGSWPRSISEWVCAWAFYLYIKSKVKY